MNAHVLERLRGWWEARRGGRSIILGWLVSRVVMLVILLAAERFIVGDVLYYRRKISTLFDVGLAGTLNEYPTPVTWLLWLPYGLTGGTRTGYLVAFIVAMLALDAAFTLRGLAQRGPAPHGRGGLLAALRLPGRTALLSCGSTCCPPCSPAARCWPPGPGPG